MLSIRFRDDREWWVSGVVFDRLFACALEGGELALSLADWQHVANANGGLGIDSLAPEVADGLARGLCAAARRQLATLGDVDPSSHDATYRASLEKLLAAVGE